MPFFPTIRLQVLALRPSPDLALTRAHHLRRARRVSSRPSTCPPLSSSANKFSEPPKNRTLLGSPTSLTSSIVRARPLPGQLLLDHTQIPTSFHSRPTPAPLGRCPQPVPLLSPGPTDRTVLCSNPSSDQPSARFPRPLSLLCWLYRPSPLAFRHLPPFVDPFTLGSTKRDPFLRGRFYGHLRPELAPLSIPLLSRDISHEGEGLVLVVQVCLMRESSQLFSPVWGPFFHCAAIFANDLSR